MKITIIENDDWVVQKDDEKKEVTVSYFEEYHFKEEIIIPYDVFKFEK